ncbi:glucosyltransferase domain-containing protein [Acetatifactor muris]|uniref:Glycosyltransferase RgtA/B/C/D-like domain-containing protein n=1 Tax=Acetatifactor muris TaxID=879566 RepID=A0A2K4ZBT7_9FIRM|nr:glucosyltransferase domain-containing protein [Acetatifactor muris]MCR2046520.1 glucosyltransferase domain-containing protein [Acetatifactor muris]SOY27912.1 hypothetical protein AMURIS_00617 [Acetatifactor muris]
MRQLKEDISFFLHQKMFVVILALTALGSYGFAVTHESIGIDDTMVDVYLNDGIEVLMGRWTIYLINKLFYLGEFMPHITEIGGVMILLLSVVLYCILLRRILGEKIGIGGYTAFACAFISQPFLGGLYLYYYHSGMDVGYLALALSLLFLLESFGRKGKKYFAYLTGSMLGLWIAVGCYESFIILYIMGLIMILFFRGMTDQNKLTFKLIFQKLALCAGLIVGCLVLRAVIQKVLIAIFSIQSEYSVESRALTACLEFFSDGNGLQNAFMLIKKYWLQYFVNAVVYFPVLVYVMSMVVFAVAAGVLTVKRKTGCYLLLFLGMMTTPFLLTLVEMMPPLYRTCQFMPFFIGCAVLLFYLVCNHKRWKKYGCVVFGFVAAMLIWNQAYEMNRIFYMDYKRYQYEKEVLTDIAKEVTQKYGRGSTVIFTGHYSSPYELADYYYIDYSSKEFGLICRLTDWLDPHLKEKYYSPYGYTFAFDMYHSMIEWGMYAFEYPGREFVNFLRMHGYSLQTVYEEALIQKADIYSENLPNWPEEGSVTEMDGYVIVHF